MAQEPKLFISHHHGDHRIAKVFHQALGDERLSVWWYMHSLRPGDRWAEEIEKGLRLFDALVAQLSRKSASSTWVMYEVAYALGRGLPIVGVCLDRTRIPEPIARNQTVLYTSSRRVAREIIAAVDAHNRATLRAESAEHPNLIRRFAEHAGQVVRLPLRILDGLRMEPRVEGAPAETAEVRFEILDKSFRNRTWSVKRSRSASAMLHEFLTDDIESYGDVTVRALERMRGGHTWSPQSWLSAALSRNYGPRPRNNSVGAALTQIQEH